MLSIRGIDTYYGDSHVLQGLSLEVAEGEVVAVLGRNGVGKTTLMRSIVRLTPPRRGEIALAGRSLAGLAPYQAIRRGIALVPQGRRMFGSLTVGETLDIACLARRFDPRARGWIPEDAYRAFPVLAQRRNTLAGSLSGGEQEMLAVARALVGFPGLLLLDEPSEGLSPLVLSQIEAQFRALKGRGVTVLMVEQNVAFALRLADRVLIMSKGRFVYEGSAQSLARDPAIREKYLGL